MYLWPRDEGLGGGDGGRKERYLVVGMSPIEREESGSRLDPILHEIRRVRASRLIAAFA